MSLNNIERWIFFYLFRHYFQNNMNCVIQHLNAFLIVKYQWSTSTIFSTIWVPSLTVILRGKECDLSKIIVPLSLCISCRHPGEPVISNLVWFIEKSSSTTALSASHMIDLPRCLTSHTCCKHTNFNYCIRFFDIGKCFTSNARKIPWAVHLFIPICSLVVFATKWIRFLSFIQPLSSFSETCKYCLWCFSLTWTHRIS